MRLLRSVLGLTIPVFTCCCVAPAASLDRIDLTVNGVDRSALLYAPKNLDTSLPVVFIFHGHGGTALAASREFRVDQEWPDAISVYPQGLPTPGALTDPQGLKNGWQHGEGAEGDRDLAFFDALLERLRHDHTIDPKRIYCTGHSNGGGFTYLLWKTRPTIFAAFAPCSAVARFAPTLTPKPAMISGGRADPLVKFPGQQATMNAIQKRDACTPTGVPWNDDATLFSSPTGTPLVTFIYDGGHAMASNESRLIVQFFKQIDRGTLTATTSATTRP